MEKFKGLDKRGSTSATNTDLDTTHQNAITYGSEYVYMKRDMYMYFDKRVLITNSTCIHV